MYHNPETNHFSMLSLLTAPAATYLSNNLRVSEAIFSETLKSTTSSTEQYAIKAFQSGYTATIEALPNALGSYYGNKWRV